MTRSRQFIERVTVIIAGVEFQDRSNRHINDYDIHTSGYIYIYYTVINRYYKY